MATILISALQECVGWMRAELNGRLPVEALANAEAALKAATPKPLPTRNFMCGGFSIRPTVRTYTGLPDRMTYGVWPKGERDHWAKRGDISETHGGCFTTWLPNEPVDAFHTFEEALAHVLKECRP